jgi:hypothetical protein
MRSIEYGLLASNKLDREVWRVADHVGGLLASNKLDREVWRVADQDCGLVGRQAGPRGLARRLCCVCSGPTSSRSIRGRVFRDHGVCV